MLVSTETLLLHKILHKFSLIRHIEVGADWTLPTRWGSRFHGRLSLQSRLLSLPLLRLLRTRLRRLVNANTVGAAQLQ